MKSMKQTLFVLGASLTGSISFAQVNVGIANSTNAAVHQSVNAGGATRAATNAATHASTHAAVATKNTVSATTSKAAEVKATTASAAQAATDKVKGSTN